MDSKLLNRAADNMRILIAEMVEKANSGHPGGAMGGADFANLLYSSFLVYDPEDPEWIARDRFFLDPGHMSPMLYSVLALTGRYTIEELQQFRQWGSVTPGHPELDPARGVENSSGPLGQGHVMAVGCAIAERCMADKFGDIVAHKTYAFISDGGIQEEVSQGAGRIAGHLGLHNLIMFYDSNKVQLSTTVEEVTSENTAEKYRSWGWNVLEVDGTDPERMRESLEIALKEEKRPTLIIGHTIMARGAVKADGSSLEGAVSTHGQPLSKAGADIEATIRNLGGDPSEPWKIFDDVAGLYSRRKEALRKIVSEWKKKFESWKSENPELAEELGRWMGNRLPALDWNSVEFKPDMPTRGASANILGFLAKNIDNMIVSSADLANSDKTDGFLKQTTEIGPERFSGRFLQSGVAELTMACLMNGIALHGGMIGACATFFVFSDYMKPAIRMSALMELPVKFIFSHDSFRVGEDGPTHEPIEQEAQIRLLEQMKNLSGNRAALVLRPADSEETLECYKLAMNNHESPSIIILSRQNLTDLPSYTEKTRREEAAGVARGGYIVYGNTEETPEIVLIGNGSDVSLLIGAAEKLAEEGIKARVISMPSVGLFLDQPADYRNRLLPEGIKQYALSSGLPSVFYPVLHGEFEAEGLQRFGASAPAKVLEEKFGYTKEKTYEKIKQFLRK